MCANLVAAKINGTWNTKLRTYTAPAVLVIPPAAHVGISVSGERSVGFSRLCEASSTGM